jgi:hypothetical protein
MNKKVILATIYGLLVSLTGVGVYIFLDSHEKSTHINEVQVQQVLPAFEDKQKEFKSSSNDTEPFSKPDVPNPTQLEQLTPEMLKNSPQMVTPPSQQPQNPIAVKSNPQVTTTDASQQQASGNPIKTDEKKTDIIERKPEERGNFDDQKSAYDEKKVN